MEDFRKFIREDVNVDEVSDPVIDNRTQKEKLTELMLNSHIDLGKEYNEPPTYLGIVNEFSPEVRRICTPCNLSAITGKAKAKKSFLQSLFVASSTLNGTIQGRIVSNLPVGKEGVLVFDTEMGLYDVYKVADRVRKLTRGENKNLTVFSLRGLDGDEIVSLVEHCIDYFRNIGMIYIDQVADLTHSINDEKEAVKVVRWLEKLSKDNDLHICCVIHQNKGNNYAGGWLGSQIMKKAETVIDVEKEPQNGDVSHVKPALTRAREFDQFSIRITDEGMPEILRSVDVEMYSTEMGI